jgi:hypothetical protein
MKCNKLSAVTVLASALVLVSSAFGQSLVGQWTATAKTPGGDASETLVVTRTATGYAITAKLVGPGTENMPTAGPGTDIVLDGDKFSYKRSIPGVLTITYSGTVSGDTFTGTVDMGVAKAPYVGVRIKPAR